MKAFLAMTDIPHGLLKNLKVSPTIRIKHGRVISRIIKIMAYFSNFNHSRNNYLARLKVRKRHTMNVFHINKHIQAPSQGITDECLRPSWIINNTKHSSILHKVKFIIDPKNKKLKYSIISVPISDTDRQY